jgi:hypothetical protein
LCDVAFTGTCMNFCTYTQGGYGNSGGVHSNGLTTTQTLDSLMQSGPIVIGGGAGNCGFQVLTTNCVLGILPGGGPSVPLAQNFSLNCGQELNNALAAQLVTVLLNIRYNDEFNNADLGAAPLSCLFTGPQIDALALDADATVDDLVTLANDYLGSICNGSSYPNGFGGTITSALSAINEYWHDCQNQNACIPGPNNLGNEGDGLNGMIIYPSPATDQVFVKFDLEGTSELKLRLFASDGKLVRTMDLVTKAGENLIEIDLAGLASGIYWINVAGADMAKTKPFTIVKP